MRPSIMSLGATRSAPAAAWESAVFTSSSTRLVIQNMEMVAVHPGHAAMAVAHVFAKADIGDDDQLGALRLDRADRLLHDAVLRVSRRRLLVLLLRECQRAGRLAARVASALFRFVGGFFGAKAEKRPACWRSRVRSSIFSLTKSGRMKSCALRFVSRTRLRRRGGAPQTARAMNQFPHRAEAKRCAKGVASSPTDESDPTGGLDAVKLFHARRVLTMARRQTKRRTGLFVGRYQQFFHQACVLDASAKLAKPVRIPTDRANDKILLAVMRGRSGNAIVVSRSFQRRNRSLGGRRRTRQKFCGSDRKLILAWDRLSETEIDRRRSSRQRRRRCPIVRLSGYRR